MSHRTLSPKDWQQLRQQFVDPGPEYRPVPFWFWNSQLDPDVIEEQVRQMHIAGLGGFFMHARFGLETEYMGGAWMECVRRAVKVAAELGMYAWLYDEYPFPSGVGGLKVTQRPEFCNQFVDLLEMDLEGKACVRLPLPDGEPLLVVCSANGETYQRLPFRRQDRDWFCDLPPGTWRVSVFCKRVLQDPRGNVFGPNYLSREMTEAFLQVLEPYVTDPELIPHLGRAIPGIFTDEPCLLAWHQNHTNYSAHHDARLAVWGDELPNRLAAMGYDWQDVLPAVFDDVGPRSAELRYAYRRVVAENYVDSFFAPYRAWCQKHGLKLTGHLLLEEGLYTNTIFQGNFMADLSYFDIPGADHLGKGCEAPYGGWGNLPLMNTNLQGQKLVSSVAHLYGKEAVLSESFGVAGWGLSLADMKRIVDWQYRLGINFLCPHAFYYSTEGFRKHDSPPSQFFQATYWPYYRHFSDYVARLSLALRAGRHVAQAALLYPLEAFWREFRAGQEGEIDRRLADEFDFYATNLLRCHLDYDIVPESLLLSAPRDKGYLKIRDEEYALIVLPSLPECSESLIDILVCFYREGGRLLLTSPLCPKLADRLTAEPAPQGRWELLEALDQGSLRDVLARLVTPAVEADSPLVTCHQRELDGKRLYFFGSDSDQPLETCLTLRTVGFVEQWDLETGATHVLPCTETSEGAVQLGWSFVPHGSLLLSVDPTRPPVSAGAELSPEGIHEGQGRGLPFSAVMVPVQEAQARELRDVWTFESHRPNTLWLDDWQMHLTAQGDWIHYDYTCEIPLTFVPEDAELLLDDVESRESFMAGMSFTLSVNGEEISPSEMSSYIDPRWKRVAMAEKLRVGTNRIHLRFTNQSWAGEPKGMTMPVKLLGRFALCRTADNRWEIVVPPARLNSGVSWTEQGYPFYSGAAGYQQEVMLEESFLAADQIWLEAPEVADMVEFIVNGTSAGVRPWPPYRVEVGCLLRAGENQIALKVTNSMQNFIDGQPKASGLLGGVRLIGERIGLQG